MLLDIEGHAKAAEFLKNFRAEEGRCDAKAKAFASGKEAYEHYAAAHQQATALHTEIGRLEKAAEELRPWGAFDVERTKKLAAEGIVLRYFFTQRSWPNGPRPIRFRRSAGRMPWCGSSSWPSPARR